MIYIYALIDPRDNRMRYIGKTTNPKGRFSQHINDKNIKIHRVSWISSLKKQGLLPIMDILDELPDDADWQKEEMLWISCAKAAGCDLTNATAGGDGFINMSPESRERVRQAWIGRKHKPESLQKMSKTRKGMYDQIFTQAYREKMSKIMKGRVFSEETKEKMSASTKKYLSDPVNRAKIGANRRKLSDEDVFEILKMLKSGYRNIDIAKKFNVSPDTICGIKKGRYYAHVGTVVKQAYDFRERKLVLYSPTVKMIIPDWLKSRV